MRLVNLGSSVTIMAPPGFHGFDHDSLSGNDRKFLAAVHVFIPNTVFLHWLVHQMT